MERTHNKHRSEYLSFSKNSFFCEGWLIIDIYLSAKDWKTFYGKVQLLLA